jgi:hypothetical protein
MNETSNDNLIITRSSGPANFDLTSEFKPAGDQPTAIAELIEGIQTGERDQVLLGVTGIRQNLYRRACHPADQAANADSSAKQNIGRPALWRDEVAYSPIMLSNISFPIMIITSPKPMCRDPIPISKKNRQSMNRLTGCAIRQPAPFLNVTMLSLSRRYHVSMALVRLKPIPA